MRETRVPWLYILAAMALVIVVVAVLLLTRVVGDGRDEATPSAATWPGASSSSGTPSHAATTELGSDPVDLGAVSDATTSSLDAFWGRELPDLFGRPFQQLAGGLQPKTAQSPSWQCGGKPLTYADVKGNAFYCGSSGDDYIAYDAQLLLPKLDDEFGGLTPAVVLAHEMGHAVQARAGVQVTSVLQELQADCFAGAWVGFAQQSATDPVSVTAGGLDGAVRALPALRDQPGTPATNPGAHGLAFDRVNAFQSGYEDGAKGCVTIAQGRATVTELPFRTVAEAESGGDLPYPQTVQFAVASLDAFWATSEGQLAAGATWRDPQPAPQAALPLPACPGQEEYDEQSPAAYCADQDAVAWADPVLAQVQQSIGDVGTAAVLAGQWALAGQDQAGLATTGADAALQRVCLTGAWLNGVAADQQSGFSLSPGDIDEGLAAVLAIPPEADADDGTGAFARAEAYRSGILGGLGGC